MHVQALSPGELVLEREQAHHARDVLRLAAGAELELFDDGGATSIATVIRCDRSGVVVAVGRVMPPEPASGITIAAALPKGDRADWMVEKLSELGVEHFIPLKTDRGVVSPAGKNKFDRWRRIAIESAKQSHRGAVMRIDSVAALEMFLDSTSQAEPIVLATECAAAPFTTILQSWITRGESQTCVLIGPEGGWSQRELERFARGSLTHAILTPTILRVETAAVAAAAVAATLVAARRAGNDWHTSGLRRPQ